MNRGKIGGQGILGLILVLGHLNAFLQLSPDFSRFLSSVPPRTRRGHVHRMPIGACNPIRVFVILLGGRTIVNFDEVVKATEKHYTGEGLRVMQFAEFSNLHNMLQLNLSLCSKVMVGPHGGGLTWSYFMKPGSRLIELMPPGAEQCGRYPPAHTPCIEIRERNWSS